jgi:hypothetical protein
VTATTASTGRAADRTLSGLIEGFWTTQLIGTAVALGIPDQLAEGASSSEQVARACEADPSCILRVLRALRTIGVCRAGSGSIFELTERGHLLRRGVPGSVSGRAAFTSGMMWNLYGQLRQVVKSGRSLPAGREGFDRLAGDPGLDSMHQAMVESSWKVIEDACSVYDFRRHARVLDVGGGYGGALSALLSRHPRMTGSVLDLEYLRNDAKSYLAKSGLSDRADFQPGDFFEHLPTGYDCYLLKYIIHDWGDADALQILQNCAATARDGSIVILLERVLPEMLEESPDHQAIMEIDIAMMTTGGGERTENEYRQLLDAAGLQMTEVIATASPCCLIIARPAP